ncbi:hypothetical protein HPP92_015673 [Vanilla planifolia]|uniref:Uncharacterized protein n=1 Tax=Vanilla planifolia TaxID=51239 RepID=A0A835URB4_VANPL|nr:hypothetical protein HPP92_015673 [Vanilla planifolia]
MEGMGVGFILKPIMKKLYNGQVKANEEEEKRGGSEVPKDVKSKRKDFFSRMRKKDHSNGNSQL